MDEIGTMWEGILCECGYHAEHMSVKREIYEHSVTMMTFYLFLTTVSSLELPP